MNFLRNRWLLILACLLSICIFGLGYVLYFNYGKSEDVIIGCIGASVLLSAILIIIDGVLYKKDTDEIEKEISEADSLYEELDDYKNRVNSLEELKSNMEHSLQNDESVIEQLKREKTANTEQIDILNRRVEELTFAAKAAEELSLKQQSCSGENNDELDKYLSTIGEWSVDTIESLNAVKKYADSQDDTELSKNADVIYANIEKILYFTKIDKLDGSVEMSDCQIGNIIKEVLKKYTNVFNEKKIGIFRKGLESIAVTNKVWLAYGFSQVLYNALYSTGEFGKISVIAKEDDDSVYLSVEDSSMGIHEEEMPDIFNPGFVSSEAKRISGNATSTCLYLAKKAFEKIDSQLSVESKYGMGTKVTIKLKKAQSQD